jgi:DNA polymerase III subunit gamma/tau
VNAALKVLSGKPWKLSFVDEAGEPTLKERADAADAAARQAILDSPMVQAAREAFPDAELETWPGQRSL